MLSAIISDRINCKDQSSSHTTEGNGSIFDCYQGRGWMVGKTGCKMIFTVISIEAIWN